MKTQPLNLPALDGGINESADPALIADNEMVQCLNFEYDETGRHLRTRPGTKYYAEFSEAPVTVPSFSLFSLSLSSAPTGPRLIVTVNSKIYTEDSAGAATFTDRTGSATINSGPRWFWRMFNNLAIGVTGNASDTNPIKYSGTGDVAALGGSPPKGKYIEVWNSRVWIVDAANPNRLYFSKVGDGADWTSTGVSGAGYIEVGYNDGDVITAIFAHKERLFIFKRRYIYQIITANPNTDNTLWRVELFTKEGGCIAQESIVALQNDLYFLSEYGYISLQGVLAWTDFEKAVVSNNVAPFALSTGASPIYFNACERPGRQEIMVAHYNGPMYLLNTQQEKPRWLSWRLVTRLGSAPNSAYPYEMSIGAMHNMVYSSKTTTFFIFTYEVLTANKFRIVYLPPDENDFTQTITGHNYLDDYNGTIGAPVQHVIVTKAYDFGVPLNFKKFVNFLLTLDCINSNMTKVQIEWFLDSQVKFSHYYGIGVAQAEAAGHQAVQLDFQTILPSATDTGVSPVRLMKYRYKTAKIKFCGAGSRTRVTPTSPTNGYTYVGGNRGKNLQFRISSEGISYSNNNQKYTTPNAGFMIKSILINGVILKSRHQTYERATVSGVSDMILPSYKQGVAPS